ncbi:hypothetical protein RB195_006390 [Necator americanus]|uniref:Uncharacterized protein n=1 Tax=Necator americanus TaxID=51031 RepID=A0ABR1BVD1_NECAM
MIHCLLLLALVCTVLATADAQSQTFDRQDRDYRPLQFGKRDGYRPLQFVRQEIAASQRIPRASSVIVRQHHSSESVSLLLPPTSVTLMLRLEIKKCC